MSGTTSNTTRKNRAMRIGAALGVASGATVATAQSQPALAVDQCIDTITDTDKAVSDAWTSTEWHDYFQTCEAFFGEGKLIVDVVTDQGVPVPAGVDLELIADAFDFGYADATENASRNRFDPYSQERWDENIDSTHFFVDNNAESDFRNPDDVRAGHPVLLLRLVGDEDDPSGPGMQQYDIQPNEMLFSWSGNGEFDHLDMLPIADVGGGYHLPSGENLSFAGLTNDGTARFTVVVVPNPVEETTTTTAPETTTTIAPETTTTVAATTTTTTTTVAPTTTAAPTTSVAPALPPAPTDVVLPETGQSSTSGLLRSFALVALGAGFVFLARRKRRPA